MKKTIEYILSQCPKSFNGNNKLYFKMTPHTPMLFINKVTEEGVETNNGFYAWSECSQSIINTLYQRLKLNEKLQP